VVRTTPTTHRHTPESNTRTYTFNRHVIQYRFGLKCGIHVYGEAVDPKGNATAAINVRCLKDVELGQIAVTEDDGRSR
jgi:hypothetical protein